MVVGVNDFILPYEWKLFLFQHGDVIDGLIRMRDWIATYVVISHAIEAYFPPSTWERSNFEKLLSSSTYVTI